MVCINFKFKFISASFVNYQTLVSQIISDKLQDLILTELLIKFLLNRGFISVTRIGFSFSTATNNFITFRVLFTINYPRRERPSPRLGFFSNNALFKTQSKVNQFFVIVLFESFSKHSNLKQKGNYIILSIFYGMFKQLKQSCF